MVHQSIDIVNNAFDDDDGSGDDDFDDDLLQCFVFLDSWRIDL